MAEIKQDIGRKSRFFHTMHLYSTPQLFFITFMGGHRRNIAMAWRYGKALWRDNQSVEKLRIDAFRHKRHRLTIHRSIRYRLHYALYRRAIEMLWRVSSLQVQILSSLVHAIFLSRDAMHSAAYAVVRCLFVRPSVRLSSSCNNKYILKPFANW